jgi:hypothetical protein
MTETIGIIPDPNNPNPGSGRGPSGRPIVMAAVGLGLLVILTAGGLLLEHHSNPTSTANQATTSPTATPTPSPANPALGSTAPNYTGFDDLLNYGLSSDQESDLKYAFTKFAASTNQHFSEVDLTNIAVAPHDSTSSAPDTATFNVTINNQINYQGRLAYSNLTAAELYLTNPQTGAQVYDSGLIDVYNGVGDN